MTTTTLLLAQPLKLTDINIKIIDEEEPLLPPLLSKIIDDAELLAILGLTSSTSQSLQQQDPTTTTLFDYTTTMPELISEQEQVKDSKRKYQDEEQDLFAQFDFKEAQLLYPTKKVKTSL